jgi:phosphohistidine phosphatase SixA
MMLNRRMWLRAALLGPVVVGGAGARAEVTLAAEGLERLKRGGVVLVMRHADTGPGTGDPPGFRLDDCSTQRNLVEAGRERARALGSALAAAGVRFETVMSSEWCRCIETAELVFGVMPATWPPLNYAFATGEELIKARERVKTLAAGWRGPGNLALVTHTPNVSALTGRSAASGQGFVTVPIRGSREAATLDLN